MKIKEQEIRLTLQGHDDDDDDDDNSRRTDRNTVFPGQINIVTASWCIVTILLNVFAFLVLAC